MVVDEEAKKTVLVDALSLSLSLLPTPPDSSSAATSLMLEPRLSPEASTTETCSTVMISVARLNRVRSLADQKAQSWLNSAMFSTKRPDWPGRMMAAGSAKIWALLESDGGWEP